METTTKQASKRLPRWMLGLSAAVVVLASAVMARAEAGGDCPAQEQRQGASRDAQSKEGDEARRLAEQRTGRPTSDRQNQRGPRQGPQQGRQGEDQGPPPRGPDQATLEKMAAELGVSPEKLGEVLKKYRPAPRGEASDRGEDQGPPPRDGDRAGARGGERGDRGGERRNNRRGPSEPPAEMKTAPAGQPDTAQT